MINVNAPLGRRQFLRLARGTGVVLAVFGGLGIATEVQAQGSARVLARLIQASNQKGEVDPRLKDIENDLRRLFRFSSYKLAAQKNSTLSPGSTQTLKLNAQFVLVLTLKSHSSSQSTMAVQLQWNKKPIINTTARMNKGANLILGGPPDPSGGAWMLALKTY
jgi:hypothetical protein